MATIKGELKTTAKIDEYGEVIIDCIGFIIPNSIKTQSSFLADCVKQRFRNYLLQCCSDNFISTKSTSDVSDVKCVEMWFCARDTAATDNMVDHGFYILDENGVEQPCHFLSTMSQFIPVRLLQNAKEGDVVPVKMRGKYGKAEAAKDIEITLNIHLSQTTTRYCRFGRFEEVLSKLLA